jgi:hypothetical protein
VKKTEGRTPFPPCPPRSNSTLRSALAGGPVVFKPTPAVGNHPGVLPESSRICPQLHFAVRVETQQHQKKAIENNRNSRTLSRPHRCQSGVVKKRPWNWSTGLKGCANRAGLRPRTIPRLPGPKFGRKSASTRGPLAGTQPFEKFFSKPDFGVNGFPGGKRPFGPPKSGFKKNFSNGWGPCQEPS